MTMQLIILTQITSDREIDNSDTVT